MDQVLQASACHKLRTTDVTLQFHRSRVALQLEQSYKNQVWTKFIANNIYLLKFFLRNGNLRPASMALSALDAESFKTTICFGTKMLPTKIYQNHL